VRRSARDLVGFSPLLLLPVRNSGESSLQPVLRWIFWTSTWNLDCCLFSPDSNFAVETLHLKAHSIGLWSFEAAFGKLTVGLGAHRHHHQFEL
jgi:hypothetical protein